MAVMEFGVDKTKPLPFFIPALESAKDTIAWLNHFRGVAKFYPDGSAGRAFIEELIRLYPEKPGGISE